VGRLFGRGAGGDRVAHATMSDTEHDAADQNKTTLLACAASCLEHVRRVKFGEGIANFSITDRGVRLDVFIRIKTTGTVEVKT
jgi:hypothetical protein